MASLAVSTLSRRELLQWILGASIASTACKKHEARLESLIEGRFVFEDQKLGHRLTASKIGSPSHFEDIDVAIIGAGVSGLSAAQELHQKAPGLNVRIFNIGKYIGGTARHGQSTISSYPWGAHYVTAPTQDNKEFVDLLQRAGAVEHISNDGEPVFKEQHLCHEPEERVFYKGRWTPGLYRTEGNQGPAISERERFEKMIDGWAAHPKKPFAIPTSQSQSHNEADALDLMSASEWCSANGFKSESFLWWVDYACRDDFGARPEAVSAWALMHYFASRRRQKKYAEVITWPEGNGHLVQTLANGLETKVISESLVYDINPKERGGADVSVLQHEKRMGFHAKQVVVCTPQFIANRIVRKRLDATKHISPLLHYSPWLVANIELSERPRGLGFEPAWDNIIYDSPSLGYVVSTHQKGQRSGPTHWTYYFPLAEKDVKAERKRLLSLSWAEWTEVILTDLEQAHPDLRRNVKRIDIARYGHGMLRPTPGLRSHLPSLGKSVGDIHFASADLSGLPLFEEAFDQGRRGAGRVLAKLGAGGAAL